MKSLTAPLSPQTTGPSRPETLTSLDLSLPNLHPQLLMTTGATSQYLTGQSTEMWLMESPTHGHSSTQSSERIPPSVNLLMSTGNPMSHSHTNTTMRPTCRKVFLGLTGLLRTVFPRKLIGTSFLFFLFFLRGAGVCCRAKLIDF